MTPFSPPSFQGRLALYRSDHSHWRVRSRCSGAPIARSTPSYASRPTNGPSILCGFNSTEDQGESLYLELIPAKASFCFPDSTSILFVLPLPAITVLLVFPEDFLDGERIRLQEGSFSELCASDGQTW